MAVDYIPDEISPVNTRRVKRVLPANPTVNIDQNYDQHRTLPPGNCWAGKKEAEKKFRKQLQAHIAAMNAEVSGLGWQFQLVRLPDEFLVACFDKQQQIIRQLTVNEFLALTPGAIKKTGSIIHEQC
ncbi:hypothetical protein [Endozoicomonas ascidiicola]|uniref:hypothetical protein n=1 Tax=Endozoicomonas ascidiicola TaxID=1698521 RepID=UPI000834304B|nr:hypothetical protein [Endozoicomonas ascidiicola]